MGKRSCAKRLGFVTVTYLAAHTFFKQLKLKKMKGFKFHHNLIYISVIMYAFDNHKWIYVFTFGMILGILLTIGELVEQWEKKQMLDIKGGINETLKDIEEFKKDLESKNETPNE